MLGLWKRDITVCDIGGGFLAFFLFAGMKQSAKEDENWRNAVGLKRE